MSLCHVIPRLLPRRPSLPQNLLQFSLQTLLSHHHAPQLDRNPNNPYYPGIYLQIRFHPARQRLDDF